jgi:hypothetical protein
MKKHSRNTQGLGAWVLGGMASVLMCVSAFGQYAATQSTPTSIPDSGTATPYPSSIDLTKSNILGVVGRVSVTVNNLTHPYAPDLGFLLVGPNNNAVVLMSDSGGNPGGSSALISATLEFSNEASIGSIGLSANSPLVSGSSYKSTANGTQDFSTFSDGPPAAPNSTTLTSPLPNANPNVVWRLYVVDTTRGPPSTLTLAPSAINFDLDTIKNLRLSTTFSDSTVVPSSLVFFDLLTTGGDKRPVTVIPAGTGNGNIYAKSKSEDSVPQDETASTDAKDLLLHYVNVIVSTEVGAHFALYLQSAEVRDMFCRTLTSEGRLL